MTDDMIKTTWGHKWRTKSIHRVCSNCKHPQALCCFCFYVTWNSKWLSQSNEFSCENYTFLQVTHSILLKHIFHTSSSEMSQLSFAWTRRCTVVIVSVWQALTTLICSSPMAVHRTIQSFSGFWKSVKALRVPLLFTAKVYAHFNRWWFVLIKLIIRVKVCLVFMVTWFLIAVK